jgi:hypothetical protein
VPKAEIQAVQVTSSVCERVQSEAYDPLGEQDRVESMWNKSFISVSAFSMARTDVGKAPRPETTMSARTEFVFEEVKPQRSPTSTDSECRMTVDSQKYLSLFSKVSDE